MDPFDRIYSIHEYGIDLESRELFVGGFVVSADEETEVGVGPQMANQFIRNIRLLESISHDPITVHLCTVGGDWSYGMAIYDAIKQSLCHVVSFSHAHARSMSSIIPLAADERYIMPNAYYMIHQGEAGWMGTHRGIVSFTEQAQEDMETMLSIYDENCELERADIERWMQLKEDVYFTAQEAVECGFMHAVWED